MTTQGEIKVGDRVRMSVQGKKKYKDCDMNPHNLEGKVLGPSDGGLRWTDVEWYNGKVNDYLSGQLEVLQDE